MDFNAILPDVRALGGETYAVCSQEQPAADQAKESWNLGFTMISDPQIVIGEMLYNRGLLDIMVDADVEGGVQVLSNNAEIAGGKYAVGVYHPGVIVLTRDFKPLFSWASLLKATDAGLRGDLTLARWQPPATVLPFPGYEYIFPALLLANGNFVRPRGFLLGADGKGNLKRCSRLHSASLRWPPEPSVWAYVSKPA